ncbi:tight adherence protein B [Frankia sp. AiPs1]|uniref:type II secretion system F family protein n=1 Tax=Frankia sp. AiPa1 TaxID=573492 RepID=UPI00202AE43C|nr:type II secretion system F family protein [Frankia sp. AiPa1]MCL9761871.1 type II secretion system F family protein [Frankia sp. AiPa1]
MRSAVLFAVTLGVGAVAWLFVGPVAATALAAGSCPLARAARRAGHRRHQAEERAQAEDFLGAFAAELDAGGPPSLALHAAARSTARAPSRATTRTRPAARSRTAWLPLDRLVADIADTDDPGQVLCLAEAGSIRQLGIAYRVCTRAGARLAPVAEMLASLARADAVRAGELAAALAGPRSSGRLVAALPAVGLALGSLAGAAPLHVLLTTPAGAACLLGGGIADLVGLRWLRAFADGVERRAAPVAMDAARPHGQGGAPEKPSAAQRRTRLLADLPLALDLIAAHLRSGGTISSALATVGAANGGALGEHLVGAARALQAGADVHTACARLVAVAYPPRWSDRLGRLGRLAARASHAVPHTRWPALTQAAVAAFDRAHRSGARPAAALTHLAERARAEAHAEIITAARRAGVLAVAPLGLCFLPAFLLLSVVPVVLGTLPGLLPPG